MNNQGLLKLKKDELKSGYILLDDDNFFSFYSGEVYQYNQEMLYQHFNNLKFKEFTFLSHFNTNLKAYNKDGYKGLSKENIISLNVEDIKNNTCIKITISFLEYELIEVNKKDQKTIDGYYISRIEDNKEIVFNKKEVVIYYVNNLFLETDDIYIDNELLSIILSENNFFNNDMVLLLKYYNKIDNNISQINIDMLNNIFKKYNDTIYNLDSWLNNLLLFNKLDILNNYKNYYEFKELYNIDDFEVNIIESIIKYHENLSNLDFVQHLFILKTILKFDNKDFIKNLYNNESYHLYLLFNTFFNIFDYKDGVELIKGILSIYKIQKYYYSNYRFFCIDYIDYIEDLINISHLSIDSIIRYIDLKQISIILDNSFSNFIKESPRHYQLLQASKSLIDKDIVLSLSLLNNNINQRNFDSYLYKEHENYKLIDNLHLLEMNTLESLEYINNNFLIDFLELGLNDNMLVYEFEESINSMLVFEKILKNNQFTEEYYQIIYKAIIRIKNEKGFNLKESLAYIYKNILTKKEKSRRFDYNYYRLINNIDYYSFKESIKNI